MEDLCRYRCSTVQKLEREKKIDGDIRGGNKPFQNHGFTPNLQKARLFPKDREELKMEKMRVIRSFRSPLLVFTVYTPPNSQKKDRRKLTTALPNGLRLLPLPPRTHRHQRRSPRRPATTRLLRALLAGFRMESRSISPPPPRPDSILTHLSLSDTPDS